VWDVEWRGGCPAEPHCTLAACISGRHLRCIFTVDWSDQGLIATGGVVESAAPALLQVAGNRAFAVTGLDLIGGKHALQGAYNGFGQLLR
jgi:hypothetical protein